MISGNQAEVVAFLASPSTHGGAPVERIETHSSIVFLAGARAWKLKRAVRYDYLDFSTVERRKAMCDAEVRINQRTAPALYRGVAAVTREADGALALGGAGTPVDWLVEMARFDQDGLLDRLAARGALDLAVMPALASAIARFHKDAAPRPEHGGREGMAWVIEGNGTGFSEQGAGILDPAACSALTNAAREALERHGARLEARRAAGFVRQCHGDLHLRNIVLLDGRPTLFDGIEFNDRIACTDVLYDLAFLLMDLWRRHLPRHANVVWNGYLTEAIDLDGIPLMPLFLSCRAAVRAKTSATAARLADDRARARGLEEMARDYLSLAQQLLSPPAPCLIAVGGLSGSGKSTIARALAPLVGAVPGAVVIRSDEIRKQLAGVQPLQRLGADGYTPGMSDRVYATVSSRAATVVQGRHAAIADAVFARAADRDAIEQAAAAAGVRFVGLWLEAPEPVLIARSALRRGDASDADAGVIRRQLAAGTGHLTWHRVDAGGPPDQVARKAAAVLREQLANDMVRPALEQAS